MNVVEKKRAGFRITAHGSSLIASHRLGDERDCGNVPGIGENARGIRIFVS